MPVVHFWERHLRRHWPTNQTHTQAKHFFTADAFRSDCIVACTYLCTRVDFSRTYRGQPTSRNIGIKLWITQMSHTVAERRSFMAVRKSWFKCNLLNSGIWSDGNVNLHVHFLYDLFWDTCEYRNKEIINKNPISNH